MSQVTLEQARLATRPTERLADRLRRGPLHAAVVMVALLWLLPTLGLLTSSFRPPRLVAQTGWWTAFQPPFAFTLENYQRVLTTNNMGQSFLNSLLVAVPATVIPILIAAYAAYALAWMRFPGRALLLSVVVGLLVVPLQMSLIPLLRLYNEIGLFFGDMAPTPWSRDTDRWVFE